MFDALLHQGGLFFFYVCFFLMMPFAVGTLVSVHLELRRERIRWVRARLREFDF